MKHDWQKVLIAPGTSIEEALRVINDGALRIALVADEKKTLLGTVSDGDIRRALLTRVSLSEPVTRIMNRAPHTALQGAQREEILAMMGAYNLLQIPLLDHAGRVVGLETLDEVIETPHRSNWVLLMAGGYGTRLLPLTETCPKPMLPVGGKPILENILESFVAAGYGRFYISVHYMQEMIRNHFGDGERWGVTIRYIEEAEPLGTAGALGLLPSVDDLPLIMMNADLLTRLSFADLMKFHEKHDAQITLCVREYDLQVPFGVVQAHGDEVTGIIEKPVYVHYVSAGIYVLSPAVVASAARHKRLDMPELIQSTIEQKGRVLRYPIHEYWLDIGRVDDLERAQMHYRSK